MYKFYKIDDLYWQIETDWLNLSHANNYAVDVEEYLKNVGLEAQVITTKYRNEHYPNQFLVDVLFNCEADEAEFIMKESK